jgi:hypothetical protein
MRFWWSQACCYVAPVLVLILVPVQTAAQTVVRKGALQGSVVDRIGDVLPGSVIVLTEQTTSLQREVRTDEFGRFTISGLPKGNVRLLVTATGYHPHRTAWFPVTDTGLAQIGVVLTVAGVGEGLGPSQPAESLIPGPAAPRAQ